MEKGNSNTFFSFITDLSLISVKSSSTPIESTALSSLILSTIETTVSNQKGIL
jgi:hypothetical protein